MGFLQKNEQIQTNLPSFHFSYAVHNLMQQLTQNQVLDTKTVVLTYLIFWAVLSLAVLKSMNYTINKLNIMKSKAQ